MTTSTVTRQGLAEILCRVLALYVLYLAVEQTLSLIPMFGVPDTPDLSEYWLAWMLPLAWPFVVALLLWVQARRFAGWIVEEGPLPNAPDGLDTSRVLSVALVVLGIIWIVQAGSTLIVEGVFFLQNDAAESGVFGRGLPILGLLRHLIVLAAGLWLTLGSRGIVNLLAGLKVRPTDES